MFSFQESKVFAFTSLVLKGQNTIKVVVLEIDLKF